MLKTLSGSPRRVATCTAEMGDAPRAKSVQSLIGGPARLYGQTRGAAAQQHILPFRLPEGAGECGGFRALRTRLAADDAEPQVR